MKIKKLIDLCKKRGLFHLFEDERAQWLSDGVALYPLYNVPGFDEETLCRTFDITEKQQEKIVFRHEMRLPSQYCFDDFTDGEVMCVQSPVIINGGSHGLIACKTSQGVMFLDRKYLVPLEDTAEGMLEIFERTTKDGQIYFAAKSGFMLLAVIMPYDAINETFVKQLKTLCEQCEVALFNKQSREQEIEQQSIFGEGETSDGAEDGE